MNFDFIHRTIIGIDPDTEKSGVAIIRPCAELREIELSRKPLWEVFEILNLIANPIVALEAGWLNAKGLAFVPGRARAIAVGRNHEIGRQIAAYCGEYDIQVILVRPKTAKWSHQEFVGITKSTLSRSNQDERDAARALIESWLPNHRETWRF